ncbi:hypothetical protein QVD99_006986 [Batrachochytrium dendrobatidis]|nr:hypothetical protein O5D80_007117 [Batrachochytrium dendrobatidis]KAJ8324873.1 hypothetical protein O5D80_006410 [Batrachochytrium dendrobatidis]KAK5664693.1 hypothetical protein QVD99_008241 [Batrachochytrium dendrobatidis]KAK5666218.1 hypothetical protein QVD99_006986 [Batrachochytrium dendrobatidis]
MVLMMRRNGIRWRAQCFSRNHAGRLLFVHFDVSSADILVLNSFKTVKMLLEIRANIGTVSHKKLVTIRNKVQENELVHCLVVKANSPACSDLKCDFLFNSAL